MAEGYDDAEPDEKVFISGIGNMSLRRAVRRFRTAREEGVTISLFRAEHKMPRVLDAVDVERLATLKRFRGARV